MLVLSRKPGERIVIDDRITVTVLEVRGNQIRLGIEAPKEIPINGRNCFVPGWRRLEWTYDDQEGCR
jgi:carbon storage regulator